ncbi:ABC transporter permease [Listeria costaricensis]|uniref:ABC transporter permease n=1 Tax=Listeria costaricensis TaxID=2026604 RepID=UPI000C0873AD|nr:ABC transporter permease [Listeria costaricensis]
MKLFQIAWKEFKLSLRDRQFFIYSLLFPIALIFVLGSVLQNAFDDDMTFEKVDAAYTLQTDKESAAAFQNFAKQADGELIHFTKIDQEKEGRDLVAHGKKDALIIIDDQKIQVVTNMPDKVTKTVLDNYIQAFSSQYQLAAGIAQVDPTQVQPALQKAYSESAKITTAKPPSGNQVTSFQYYAIALIAMAMMFGVMNGANTFRIEKTLHTYTRLQIAPVSKMTVLGGNFLGTLGVNTCALLILMLFSGLFFDVDWGRHAGFIFCIYLSLLLFSVALGILLDIVSDNNPAVLGAGNLLVQVFCFLGGAYYPMVGEIMPRFSPVGWLNIGVRNLLYQNEWQDAALALAGNLIFTALFIGISLILIRRKEVY